MKKKQEHYRAVVFRRRVFIIGGVQLAILGGVVGRLYGLTIARGAEYRAHSDENRIATRMLVPQRGLITDRYGTALALNVPSFEVYLTADKAKDAEATFERLIQFLHLKEEEIAKVREQMEKKPSFVPALVRRNLSQNEAMIIDAHTPELPGAEVVEVLQRFYPDQAAFAHIVGYVSSVTKEDVERNPRPLLRMPNFKIGKQGIEKYYDEDLLGKPGSRQIEVTARGRPIREISRIKPVAGSNLKLTISRDLQNLALSQVRKHRAGSAVLLDAYNGDVLACVSHPAYDPNMFVRGFSTAQWEEVVNNPDAPLNNKALKGVYAPGSTYKMVVLLAAMRANVSPNLRVNCQGRVVISGQAFHCWKREGHGAMNMHDSLVHSCDIYYYEMAQRVGIDRINEVARLLGFGNEVTLDFRAGEGQGLVPTREWKERVVRRNWNIGDTVQASIGQGYMLATPMQLATMTARIATGRLVSPRFVLTGEVPIAQSLGLEEAHLREIRRMMDDVVNSDEGTARGSRIVGRGMSMAGKTGTAQVRRISTAERESGVLTNDDIDYLQRDHSLFVGYGPVDQPRYVASVVIEHGGSGSAVAAPIARDMLAAAMVGQPQVNVEGG